MRVWRFGRQEQATILGPNMFAPTAQNRKSPSPLALLAYHCKSLPIPTSKSLNTGAFIRRKLLIEFQVEFKYIDSCFAKNS